MSRVGAGIVASRRRWVGAVVVMLLALLVAQATVRSTSAVTPDPATQGIGDVLSALSALESVGPLGQPFPLSDTSPADLVGLGDLFDDLDAALGDAELTPGVLEGMQGTYGPFAVVVNGPDGASEATVAPSPGDATVRDVIFQIEATAADVELPVSVADDLVTLDGAAGPGGTVTVDVVLSTTVLHFQYDDGETDPSLLPQALWLRTMPASPVPAEEQEAPGFELRLTASGEAIDAFTAHVGLADVEVTGSLDLDAVVRGTLLDPDGAATDDKISLDEVASTSILDLVDLGFVDADGVDDLDASLTLSATSVTGLPDATVAVVDADLSADPAPVPSFDLGEQENLLNMTPSDVISAVDRLAGWLGGLGATGRFDVEIPFLGGTFSDALDMAQVLTDLTDPAAGVLRHAADVPGTPIDETGLPTFRTLAGFDDVLTAAGYPLDLDYDTDANVVRFDLDVADSITAGQPIAFGSLDVVDGIRVTADGTANLAASYDAGLGVALDLTPLDEEAPGAGPLSCVDGLDNDGTDGIDAADPDCADIPTLEQRVLLDVGTSAGTPEISAELSFDTNTVEAVGTIGLLNVDLGPITAALDDGGGNPASIGLDLYETGPDADGLLTIEELLNAFGAEPGAAVAESSIDASFAATLPVSADLNGTPLGGGDIVVTADVDGPFADPRALLADGTFDVDASDLEAAALFDFSPCANALDDDGDGTANDGCPGGPAPVSDPESESTASLQAIIELIRALGTQLDTAGLDVELPLLGRSFDDLVDLAGPLTELADRLTTPAESAIPGACDPGPSVDDDADGAHNDGCPTQPASTGDPDVQPAPEVGEACANTIDDDGDGYVNDGCLPISPSLQTIAGFVQHVINTELAAALDALKLEGSTPTVTVDVDLTYDDAAGDLSFLLHSTLGVRTGTTFNVDLGAAVPALAGYDVVALETTGSIALDVAADFTIGFGLELAAQRPFLLGDTELTVDVDAAGEELELGAGIGPLKIQLGNTDPLPETGAECDAGTTDDDDGDGFANDGCPAHATPEPLTDCGNGIDDDSDGIADDGCAEAAPQEGDDPETACGNGLDDDGDGVADDGCGTNVHPATDGDGVDPAEDEVAGECDRGNTADEDGDGFANDGCPARGNPGLAYAGATLGITEAGADGDKHYFDSAHGPVVDFSGSPGLAGSPPAQCDDLVGNADADACASLPIYLDVNGSLTYLSPLTIDWDDYGTAPTITVDEAALIDALEQQMLDLLLLESGLGAWLQKVEAMLRDGLFGLDLPLIGDALDQAADFVAGLQDAQTVLSGQLTSNPIAGAGSVGAVQTAVDALATAVDDGIDDQYQQPGGVAAAVTGVVRCDDGGTVDTCDGSENLDDIEEILLTIPLGQQGTASTPGFDIGIPGLGLTSDGTLDVTGSWAVTLGLGVSRTDGFFLDTSAADELQLGAEIDLPDHLEGQLGFLQVDIFDGGPSTKCVDGSEDLHGTGVQSCDVDNDGVALPESSFDPTFTVDLLGNGDGKLTLHDVTTAGSFGELFNYDLTVPADVNLHVVTSIVGTDGSFPRLFADLTIDWGFSITDSPNPDALRDPAQIGIALSNTALDAGSFLRDFLGPIVRDAQRFTKPLDPVIEQLTAPIPVLSDFAGQPVTLLDLIETFASSEVELGLLFDMVKFVDFVNGLNIPSASDGLFVVPFGSSFDLDSGGVMSAPLDQSQARGIFDEAQLTTLDDAGSLVDDLDGAAPEPASDAEVSSSSGLADIGLHFPFLDRPSQLLGLLFGQDVDLIIWQPDELRAEFSYSQKFGPIWAVPPVFLEIGGSAAVTGRFGIGYDTQGLREVLFEGADAGALLHGMFLLDRRLQDDGTFAAGDPAEIELSGRLFANAQVSVLIFSAGAEGSVFLTVGLNVHDDNSDGKLKYQEAANILRATGNPICLFDFEGEFGVSIDVFAEVDLFFWSQRWVQNLARVILYEWKVSCAELKEPTLASPATIDLDDTSAYPRPDSSDHEMFGPGDENVLQLNLGALRAQRGSGTVGQDETKEGFVVKKQLDGSLTVTALGISQNFPPPSGGWDAVYVDGGSDSDSDPPNPGFDTITLADNVQKGENTPVAGSTETNRCAGHGDDDGDGVSNDGCPAVGDAETACTGAGSAADDDGDGTANDGCPVVETAVPFDLGAYIKGSNGNDHITGGHGPHVIYGNGGDDTITTKESQDLVSGGSGADQIGVGGNPAGAGNEDFVDGGTENDVIDGGPGADILKGGGGDDRITGGQTVPAQPGDPAKLKSPIPEQPDLGDRIEGGSGADDLEGGAGADTIVGGSGPDRLNGGEGGDTLWGNGENDPAHSGSDACTGFPADNSYDDVLVGGPGADSLHAGAGDDIVVGGNILAGGIDTGDTILAGDPGCDLIVGDNASFDDDADPRRFSVIDPLAGGGDTITSGSGADVVHGMVGDDTADGDAGNDTLFGQAGNDVLDGGDDVDTIWGDGGPGQPVPYAGAGDDDVIGGDGGDFLFGEEGADVMLGDEGTVDRKGTASRDDDAVELTGGSGADQMRGGRGPDEMYGQDGNDVMHGDAGTDLMYGNDGADDMRGGIDDDELFGGDGDTGVSPAVGDTMRGDAGADRMVGGSDVDAGWPAADDGLDTMHGGSGPDVMVGDNGVISSTFVETLQSVGEPGELASLGGAGDLMYGEADTDRLYGELGNDRLYGGTGDDYLEGNANGDGPPEGVDLCDAATGPHADWLFGQADQDDLVGGGHDPGHADGADCMYGGGSVDVMTGDNALVTRPGGFDVYDGAVSRTVELFDLLASPTGIAGADVMLGEAGPDRMFGGGADEQLMRGGDGDDHMEGNGGGDTIYGDAGQDDIIGGTSQGDGPGSVFTGRHVAPVGGGGIPDGADVVRGDDDTDDLAGGTAADHDLIAGDNASLIRPVDGAGAWQRDDLDPGRGITQVVRRALELFDVATADEPDADTGVSGGDQLYGQHGADVVYGQGGVDVLRGGLLDDYLEGGNGSDDVQGGDGQDDIVGGTGRTRTWDPGSADDGRLDDADTLYGGNGDPSEANDGSDDDDFDVVMGDNATVLRGATGTSGEPWTHHDFGGAGVAIVDRIVTLHDVETVDSTPPPGTSGGDTLYGEDADDLLHGQGGNDTAYGGGGDDLIEGNAGDDTLHGEADQDDMLGGTGLIRWWDEHAGEIKVDTYDTAQLVGGTAGRVDGADVMYGGADHDVMLGDNGIVDRLADGAPTWVALIYGHFPVQHDATDADTAPEVTGSFTRWDRTVRMTDPPESDGGSPLTSGSDRMSGGDGDDDLYGQFDDTADDPDGSFAMTSAELVAFCPTSEIGEPGDGLVELWGDLVCGGAGEDAVLGDQGVVTNEVAAGPARFIEPKDPFVTEWIDIPGSLVRRTALTTFAEGGDDVLLGGDDSDSMHGGAGGDVVNAGNGDDRVFGGDSPRIDSGDRLDALWGGPDNDHVYGGHGDDFIDVQPRVNIENFPDDPEQWFVFAPVVDTDADLVPDRFPGFEDFDQHYGGWNQDALQADKGDNGPVRGDRLLDWAGAHNVYYLCPSTYGAYVSIRAQEPGLVEYVEDMAEGDGLVDVRSAGSSGYNELAMVYKKDVKDNANPAHPDTPGHFSCAFVP